MRTGFYFFKPFGLRGSSTWGGMMMISRCMGISFGRPARVLGFSSCWPVRFA